MRLIPPARKAGTVLTPSPFRTSPPGGYIRVCVVVMDPGVGRPAVRKAFARARCERVVDVGLRGTSVHALLAGSLTERGC